MVRRDGSVPVWPHFVLGAADPASRAALHAYAHASLGINGDRQFAASVIELADGPFREFIYHNPCGDPLQPKHRTDDPLVIRTMRGMFDPDGQYIRVWRGDR